MTYVEETMELYAVYKKYIDLSYYLLDETYVNDELDTHVELVGYHLEVKHHLMKENLVEKNFDDIDIDNMSQEFMRAWKSLDISEDKYCIVCRFVIPLFPVLKIENRDSILINLLSHATDSYRNMTSEDERDIVTAAIDEILGEIIRCKVSPSLVLPFLSQIENMVPEYEQTLSLRKHIDKAKYLRSLVE